MKKLALLACFVFVSAHLFAQSVDVQSVTVLNGPLDYCTTSRLTVSGQLDATNYTYADTEEIISGFNITVNVNYTSSGLIIPAFIPFSHTANLGVLPVGTYTVTTNGILNGTIESTDVTTIEVFEGVTVDASEQNPTCGNDNGSIALIGFSVATPLQYSIDGGITFQSGNEFSGLSTGTYNVVVMSSTGCETTDQVTLSDPGAPEINTVATSDPACGNANGAITITATDGLDPLRFSIDNGVTFQESNSFNGLTSATYSVVVSDANDCEATTVVTLVDIAPPAITDTDVTDPTCGENNGAITITASGVSTPLQYSTDNGVTFQANNTFSGLSTGTYDLVVEDANGCLASEQVTLTDPGVPTISNVSVTDPICTENSGSIQFTTTGGSAPFSYSIDNGITFQSSNAFTSLSEGSYNLVAEDANGCQATTVSILTFTNPPTIDLIDATSPVCEINTGAISITASGEIPPLQYSIDNGVTFQASNSFSGLAGGATYTVVVEDALGCQATEAVSLNSAVPIGTPEVGLSEFDICDGNTGRVNFATSSIGGTPPFQYSLDNGVTFQSSFFFGFLSAGLYNWVVKDENGCQASGQITVLASSTIPNINIVNLGPALVGSVSTDPPPSFRWLDCDNDNAYIDGEDAAVFPPTQSGNYALEVAIGTCTDTSDCEPFFIVDVDENSVENQFSTFPNPTTGVVTVSTTSTSTYQITVTDLKGRAVHTTSAIGTAEIDLHQLQAGIYILAIEQDDVRSVTRLVKH